MDRRRAGNTHAPTREGTRTQVQAGYHACTIAHPLQKEGGDNYLNARQLQATTSEPPHSENTHHTAAAAGSQCQVTKKFTLLNYSAVIEENVFTFSKRLDSRGHSHKTFYW